MTEPVILDAWRHLANRTPARIALGRAGAGLPTEAALQFALAHAKARDAVHAVFNPDDVAHQAKQLGFETVEVTSAATSRELYLARPDLGRRLDETSRSVMSALAHPPIDLVVVMADGLSPVAVHRHAVPLLAALQGAIAREGWRVAPLVLASQARVALGDEIGELLQTRAVLMLIGERPGLSSADSLGAYLTFEPRRGRHDGERNCVSNIHGAGLSHDQAAFRIGWLLREAFARQLTGVDLKDQSGSLLARGPDAHKIE